MLLFLDTEFTNLAPPAPRLMSLAMVSEDGRRSFYGEILPGAGWDMPDCSEFVLKEVLPLFKGGEYGMTAVELRAGLTTWIRQLHGVGPHRFACDSNYDISLLGQLLGPSWPPLLDRKAVRLDGMIYAQANGQANVFEHAFKECLARRGAKAHNALDDAYALRAGWLAVMSASTKRGPTINMVRMTD